MVVLKKKEKRKKYGDWWYYYWILHSKFVHESNNKKPDNLFLQVGAKFKLSRTQTGQEEITNRAIIFLETQTGL